MIWAKILLLVIGLSFVLANTQDNDYTENELETDDKTDDELSRVRRYYPKKGGNKKNNWKYFYQKGGKGNYNKDGKKDEKNNDQKDLRKDDKDDKKGKKYGRKSNGKKDGKKDDGAICYASGDPHYKTFDQRYYDFQGNCQYILTKPCNSENFSVIVSNKQCNTYVTCTVQVTVLVPSKELNNKIILGRGKRGTVTINGYTNPENHDGIILQSTEVQVVRVGGQLHVTIMNGSVNIFWNGHSRVEVKVLPEWQGKLCGLCGNYNLDKTDDFKTPDGAITTTPDSFGNSWLYNDGISSNNTCVGLPKPPKCSRSNKKEAKDKCRVLKEEEFKSCNKIVNPDEYIANCEYDYCLCKEEDREDCYCESLATYASACTAAGVSVNWRTKNLCSPECPLGMVYQQCGSMCPQTCETDENTVCTEGCAEGCFCPNRKVLDNDGYCIRPSKCAKCPNGMVFKQCGPLCPQTCGRSETSSLCSNNYKSICKKGCFCPDGTVLFNGQCIDPVNCPGMRDDPHFIVPLLSKEVLCYSIQGYPGLAFNLIHNKNFVINAHFVDSIRGNTEATWIGKLAVIPTRRNNNSDAIIFDSVNQEVIMVGQGKFKAEVINEIVFSDDDKTSIKFTTKKRDQGYNPTIHVTYAKPLANFDVKFFKRHLNVDWDIVYENVSENNGLMGQFMTTDVHIDTQRQIMIFPDGRNPVPVTKDTVMTGKPCWKAMNYGYQGEGLIKGKILDYIVPNILVHDFHIRT